jgi:hypothetical protein
MWRSGLMLVADGSDLFADLFLIRESSRASDVLRSMLELLSPSVGVRRRPLMVAAVVTHLVTQSVPSNRNAVPVARRPPTGAYPDRCRPGAR